MISILETYGTGIGWAVVGFGIYCMYLVTKLIEDV